MFEDRGNHYFKTTQRGRGCGDVSLSVTKDSPIVQASLWGGVDPLSFHHPFISNITQHNTPDDRIEYDGSKATVRIYTLSQAELLEDGGLEFDIVLKSKPSSNKFNLDVIGWENYDWLYQPSFLDAPPDIPFTDLTATEALDSGVVVASRPESVVGSYAVYHKVKRGHRAKGINYATGKAFHILRPKLIDNHGVEEWGELSFDAGRLTIEASRNWLRDAAYPVVVDPTFGYTTAGGSWLSPSGDDMYAYVATSPEAGTGDSMTAYCDDTISTGWKGCLVNNSGLTIVSNGITNAQSPPSSAAWSTATFSTSPTIAASTVYNLAVIFDAQFSIYYDSGSSGDGERDTSNSYASPANWGSSQARSERFSIYITYTASGGGGPTIPVFNKHFRDQFQQ